MNDIIKHTRGDDFEYDVHLTYPESGEDVPITGWSFACQGRRGDEAQTLIQTFTIVVLDDLEGRYRIQASKADTRLWVPDDVLYVDIEYLTDTGKTFSSPTFRILVEQDQTF